MQASNTVLQSLKSFLQKDPNRLKTYVKAGLTAVDFAVGPLSSLMRHLLVVQGIDPNTKPGAKRQRELEAALMVSFNRLDDADFDSDYDFSWLANKFSSTSKKLEHLKLTKDKFHDLTDLHGFGDFNPLTANIASKYDSHTVTVPGTGPALVESPIGTPERTVESFFGSDEAFEKIKKASKSMRDFEEANPGVLSNLDEGGFIPSDSDNHLRFDKALDTIKKYADLLDEPEETPSQAYDPRDPSLERLKQLLERVEGKFGQKLTDEAKSKLQDILPGLELPKTEEPSNKNESSKESSEIPSIKTSKKTVNKTHRAGAFRRSTPPKKG